MGSLPACFLQLTFNLHKQEPLADYEHSLLLRLLLSLRSIRAFVESFTSRDLPLYCLINNAGVQTIPDAKTEDGFEVCVLH